MAIVSYSPLIFLLPLIICYNNIEASVHRHRRQVVGGTNTNVGNIPQQNPAGSMPLSNYPVNPANNPNLMVSNQRNDPKQANPNMNFPVVSQSQAQMESVRSQGYYNNPSFQSPPFAGEKPAGWFGTNHINWVSNRDTELDKNKLAADKIPAPNNPPANVPPPRREDGGPLLLQKIAKLYASKGQKGFNFGQLESRQGHGSLCSNHENFDGYVFGTFACPLPSSTGMNQLDQFCCGPVNYQYCCNMQEFHQSQRGGFIDPRFLNQQRFPKQSTYPPSTRKFLAIILPISSFVVLTGIGVLVYLYYKKFRNEQHRTRRPPGAVRLDDTYSIVPQESPMNKTVSLHDEL